MRTTECPECGTDVPWRDCPRSCRRCIGYQCPSGTRMCEPCTTRNMAVMGITR
jgi:hypothetical protein